MEVVEEIYEFYGAPSKTKHPRGYLNYNSGRNSQVLESAFLKGPTKDWNGKHRKLFVDLYNGDKLWTPLCFVHGARHSSEEFKALWYYKYKYKWNHHHATSKETNIAVDGEDLNEMVKQYVADKLYVVIVKDKTDCTTA